MIEMATKHHISRAAELYYGDAYDAVLYGTNERVGVRMTPVTRVSMGSPIALDTNALIAAATSTELPNAETVTYTVATTGTTPTDDAGQPAAATVKGVACWKLDVPRNVTAAVTHGSSIVAMTIVVNGYDKYLQAVSETLSITATGTSKTAATEKAFAYVSSIAITAAGDAEANTLSMGFGDVLGLPYAITAKSDIMQAWFNDIYETTAPTVVVADTATATATTGDVRGTIDLNSALDGSAVVLYMAVDPSTRASLLGVDNYGG